MWCSQGPRINFYPPVSEFSRLSKWQTLPIQLLTLSSFEKGENGMTDTYDGSLPEEACVCYYWEFGWLAFIA